MTKVPKKFTEDRPAEAMRFAVGNKNGFAIDSQDGKHAVSLVAFSGREFYHWWWGRCIFDREGAVIPHEKIPIDYQHDPNEVLGYLDQFSGDTALEAKGYLVPFGEQDRVNEILFKKSQGVPYQCSVSLGGTTFEFDYIPKGAPVEVNGQSFDNEDDGLVVFRHYEVHGVAICLYGSDSNTTVFNRDHHTTMKGGTMPQFEKQPENDQRELAKKFAKRFGEARGFKYFSEGKDEEEAKDAYIDDVEADVIDKDAQIAELNALIESLKARIAELEAAPEPDGETMPTESEDFKALKLEFKKLADAMSAFTGEPTPVGKGGTPAEPKKFSPFTPAQQAWVDKYGIKK